MQNSMHLHDLKIIYFGDDKAIYKQIEQPLLDLKNELQSLNLNSNLEKEYKMYQPDVIILNLEIKSHHDFELVEKISKTCVKSSIIVITKAYSVTHYELLLKLNIEIILIPIDTNTLLDRMGLIAKNRKLNSSLSIETKLDSIGDIVANIAHQWRQPLNRLSGIMLNISAASDFNKLTPEFIQEKIKKADDTIKYLSQTIEDFKRFYSTNRMKEEFDVKNVIKEAIDLTGSPSKDYIQIHFIVNANCKLLGQKKEFFQAVVNIIHNAKDQLKLKNIAKPTITISLGKNDSSCYVIIEDNAGGIEVEPIEKIFFPYKTTKKENGTGLGLYITKIIIEDKMNGQIIASNTLKGAKFHITVPYCNQ